MLDHQAARRLRQGAYAAGALALVLATTARAQDLPILTPPAVAPAGPGAGTATSGGDAAHRNAWSGTGLRPPLAKAWSVKADGSAVVAGTLVVVPTATAVTAYAAATGERAWTVALGGAELATDGTRVFAATGAGVAALTAATGAPLWGQAGGASGPTLGAGKLWVGSADGHVKGLDPATGKPAVSAATDIAGARPAVSGSRVYVTSSCDAYALNASSGAVIWHTGACGGAAAPTLLTGGAVLAPEHAIYSASGGGVGFAGPAPGTAGAGLLLRARAGGLDAYDGATLAHRWSWAGTPLTPPAVTDAVVWQVAGDDALVALDPASGREQWSGYLPRSGAPAPVPLAVGDGLLLVPSAGRRLTALRNARAGALIVAATIPENVVGVGAAVPVTGKLRSAGHGLVGPRAVTLEGDVFPFDGTYAALGSTQSDRQGFKLTTPVARNTRLRLTADGVSSRPTTVYARPQYGVVYARTRHKLVVDATLRVPAEPGLDRAGRVGVYRVHRHGRVARRLGGGTSAANGVAHFTVRLPPLLKRSDQVVACLRETSRQGYGAPNALDRHCGDRRISLPQGAARRSLSTGTGSLMPLKRLWPASEKA